MNQAINNMDTQYDTTGRLSAEDKLMMTSGGNRFADNATATPMESSPAKPVLSTTPKDTSFMTEEKLKTIYMPKRIEF